MYNILQLPVGEGRGGVGDVKSAHLPTFLKNRGYLPKEGRGGAEERRKEREYILAIVDTSRMI